MAIEVGKKAPAFTLIDQNGRKISLADFEGKWTVVYFYPKDDTPGCTIEAIEFTKHKKKFEKLGAVVLGISPDDKQSHCDFRDKHKLTVELLSDPNKTVMKKYGAWGMKNLYGKKFEGVIRSTTLIDPKGKVALHWKSVKAKGHASAVLKKIENKKNELY